ncbi:MAG: SusC/RagA family TonB-linked outer membrane protein [Bacteroidota bacterium]
MKKKILQILLICVIAFFSINAIAQQTVIGEVANESGEVLPGVSVSIKGTTQGTVTDNVGKYSISVPGESSVLVFSFVGMETQEIVVGNQSTINVTLTTSAIGLDDVVVTALGITREKKSLGYSVAEVEGESLQKVAQENVLNALSGRVAGVQINSVGGAGSSVSMVIRGASSLTSDNQPLFVVDGIPMNNTLNNVTEMARDTKVDFGNAISDINSEDIESVSVLKGPSAAALYGSRAGNGVVLIITKSGRKSKGLGITITTNTVIENPYKYLEKHTMMANGKRPYTHDNRPNNGLDYFSVPAGDSYWVGPELDKGMMAYQWPYFNEAGELTARPLVSHPDNYKKFFETGYTTTNGVTITDASEKVNYRLSYNNMQNKGIVPNSDIHRNSISLNSSVKLVDNITVSSSLNIAVSGADNRPSLGNRGANPLQYLYDMNSHLDIEDMRDYWVPGQEGLQQRAPYNLVVNSDGTYGVDDMMNNPFFIANEVNNSFRRDRVYGNAKADWQINTDWSAMVRYTHDQLNEQRETKIAPSYSKEPNGFYGILNMYSREQNADFLFAWNKTVDDINFSASAGGNYMYKYSSSHQTQSKRGGSGLIVPNVFSVVNITPDNLTYNSGYSEKAIYSLYALASVGYKDAVYLDLTARNDWSSTLPAENRSYFYPSASVSILFNNLVDLGNKVSLAKLRGGWAMVGNDTDPYRLMASMGNAGAWGNQPRLGTSGTLLLPDLKPEIQTSWEIGADLAFYNSRLTVEGTYYQAENENQILSIGLPPSSGYNSKQINAGLISSKGVEFMVGGTPVSNTDWNWDVNLVFSRNRTTIEELAEGFNYLRLWTDAKGGAVTRVGDEIGQIVDRELVRVNDPDSPYHGWPIIDDEGWEDSNKWENLINDPDAELPVIGNFNPDFMLGLQTTLSYKKWTLSANFDWRVGGQFVSQTFRYGESDLHTQRWMDKTLMLNDMSGAEMAQYLRDNAANYLSPDGEFFVIVGGPTEETGGLQHTEGGITLNDGVFMPGVEGYYDDNGNFIMVAEHLGEEGTPLIRYQDFYGWSFTRNATFDADFIKLREISVAYDLGSIKSFGIQNASLSLYSRNIILWTKAGINIDPETAFQAEGGVQGSGIQFKQGIERYNVTPWSVPIGIKLNVSF